MHHWKNGLLQLRQGTMEYIRFGTGERILLMLPGLGDGLRTVKGTALPMALIYRAYTNDFTVYAFSRKHPLPEGYSTRDMARDQAEAMGILGLEKADILGVSMGGMIAQHLAIDYPQKVNHLILAVTASRPNPVLMESVNEWIAYAEKGDHTGFMGSNLRRIYSEGYCRKNSWMVPILGRVTRPGSYDRFFVQADACLTHEAWERLDRIQAPTLVIGGGKDLTLGGKASEEIAERIPGAVLKIYPKWGHGVYEEERDFNRTVMGFLLSKEIPENQAVSG